MTRRAPTDAPPLAAAAPVRLGDLNILWEMTAAEGDLIMCIDLYINSLVYRRHRG